MELQTPEFVKVILPGGGMKTYATEAFLGLNPQNLSTRFRVRVLFGIDYAHQEAATAEIPELMSKHLHEGLKDVVAPGELLRLAVEFKDAGASSLNYEIIGDFSGVAAERYEYIQRALARLLVEASTEHGWEIPFTQLTLHQAAAA